MKIAIPVPATNLTNALALLAVAFAVVATIPATVPVSTYVYLMTLTHGFRQRSRHVDAKSTPAMVVILTATLPFVLKGTEVESALAVPMMIAKVAKLVHSCGVFLIWFNIVPLRKNALHNATTRAYARRMQAWSE